MKKIYILILCLLFITGCSAIATKDIVKKFEKKVNNVDSYFLKGDLELRNNDEVYNYDVEVSYEKEAFYKVKLTNTTNNATQVILKNKEGVYVLTPSLNRSFKFQSDWPYNNSQVYLLKSIVNDLINDKNIKIENKNEKYLIVSSVNYPNNKDLTSQKVVLDNKLNLKSVTVYDKESIPTILLKVKKLNYSPSFKKDYFSLDSVLETTKTDQEVKETMTIEDSIYPLVLPTNTKLSNEEKIKKTDGERVLMTFDGDKPFLLVEETANIEDEFTVIPTNGVPFQLMDTLGVMTDNSLSWITNGIEYYLVSDVMSGEELVNIAQSIYTLPVAK